MGGTGIWMTLDGPLTVLNLLPAPCKFQNRVDHSSAPSKTRLSSPVIGSLRSCILFPATTSDPSSPSWSGSSSSDRVDSNDDSPDDSASMVFVQPPLWPLIF